MTWKCGINGCSATAPDLEALIDHQTAAHDHHKCRVCGETVPDGYLAIAHVFSEHTRADFVRAYDADSTAIRKREDVLETAASVSESPAEPPLES